MKFNETKYCLDCNKPINGRSDKKFCDDSCRNSYNNKLNAEDSKEFKKINAYLKKNRKLFIQLLNNENKITVSEKKLNELGFQYDYITGIYTTKAGVMYKLCYEFAWLKIENGKIMLLKREK